MNEPILAWHFANDTLRDGSQIPDDNIPLTYVGELTICKSGLHAANKILDALTYAPGDTICRVQCSGVGENHENKFVCAKRTILWRINGKHILRQFSRRIALDVAHLWKMPEIVRLYLEKGDERIRAAAYAATGATTWVGAYTAAGDAAWVAAYTAAGDFSWVAARNAAYAAAWVDARAAAWVDDRKKYNDWLTEMVETAHANE